MTTVARPGAIAAPAASAFPARVAALIRGTDAAWVRPAQIGVTLLAAVFYLANLTVSGLANAYYSAAALAASQSWTAWFFGSIDASNFITVDKPPLATMLMGLSVRIFGLSSWSILLPEALCGIATVAILFAIVRRSFGPVAATIAGVVMAVMPVSVLIFRYNNPDALLTLLLVVAAGALLRGLEHGRIRWAVLAAVLVGFAFNTKLLQAYLVLPVFAFVWAVAAPGGIRRRIAGLGAAVVAVIVSSAWWVAAVELIPAASRPFIGGSTTNSALDLVFGYDGLGRIFGMGGGGGGGGGGGFSGTAGILRLFNAELGGQIAWLLPFALIALVTGIALRGRLPRTDSRRAAYLLWGGWIVVTGLVFSFMSGVIHSYYAVALVPAIAALVGAGVVDMWALRQRSRLGGVPLAAAILSSAAVACILLERTADFVPGLGIAVFAIGMVAAVVIALPIDVGGRVRMAALAIAMIALLAGPVAYSLDTVATAHSGGDPSAGPSVASVDGRGGPAGGFGGQAAMTGTPPSGGQDGTPPSGDEGGTPSSVGGTAPMGLAGGMQGGVGADATLTAYLLANRGTAAWIVAVDNANSAAPIELATGAPVMAMGGFTGSDPAPTLAELKAYVASGQLRFVIVGGQDGMGGGRGGSSASSDRTSWITSTCALVDDAGTGSSSLYDCAGAVATGG